MLLLSMICFSSPSKDWLHNKTTRNSLRTKSSSSQVLDIFSRWRQNGITIEMISCCASVIVNDPATEWNLKRISVIHVRNETVKIEPFKRNVTYHRNDAAPSRMYSIKSGIISAIEYAKDSLNISIFPDFVALFVPSDESQLIRPLFSSCTCNNKSYAWPPILAQNREYLTGNLFVTIPDFSFFTLFKFHGNHGTKEDIWFDVMRNEQQRNTTFNSSYHPIDFTAKPLTEVVWRGRVTQRRWGHIRAAVQGCNTTGLANTDGSFISRPQMCSQYQLILTLPGNGVWSWATKFNLVSCCCNQRKSSWIFYLCKIFKPYVYCSYAIP